MKVKLLEKIAIARDGITIIEYNAGDIVDVSEDNAESLIFQKKAEKYNAKIIEGFKTKTVQKEAPQNKTKSKRKR